MDLTSNPRWTSLFQQKLLPVPVKMLTGFEGERWRGKIPVLRRGYYYVTVERSVGGDAPKDFIHVYRYGKCRRANPRSWPGFIAKVGHKWYPAESITEQLMTRIGECLGLRMAESLLMNCQGQIRFLSQYFLGDNESLVHGAEIVAGYLEDEEFVEDVEEQKLEKDLFTFEVLCEAIGTRFAVVKSLVLSDFVRMLGFDALVGNQDRHLYNWGVIIHVEGKRRPVFSPIYDSARGLFWNVSEENLARYERPEMLDKYIRGGRPLIGCDTDRNANHFRLMTNIASHDSRRAVVLEDLVTRASLRSIGQMIDSEFEQLLSKKRRTLIKQCLARRFEMYADAVQERLGC